MSKEVKQWITVNGHHVPIFEGESKAEAVKRAVNKQGGAKKTSEKKAPARKQLENVPEVVQGTTASELHKKLEEQGLGMESADASSLHYRDFNDEEVSLYDAYGNEYRGVFTKGKGGGYEVTGIHKEWHNRKPTDTYSTGVKEKDEVAKEKQIAANKTQADERNGKKSSNSEDTSKEGKKQAKDDWMKKVDNDKLWDIAERYNTSNPVSGNWDDETSHEQKAIAKEFGISLSQAKKVMIDKLGYPEKLEEGDHWATESKKASNKKNKLSFSADEASKKINSISMAHNNRGGDTENDWKQIRDTLENAPVGTVMIQIGDRGVKFQHTKGQDGKWHDGKGWDADSKTMSMGWVGQGHRPTVEFTTSDKALTPQQIKDTHDAATSGKLNQHLGLDKNGKKIGNRSVPKISSSKQNKIKKILGDDKKMAEWKINKAYDRASLTDLALDAGLESSYIRSLPTDELRAKLLAMWKKG